MRVGISPCRCFGQVFVIRAITHSDTFLAQMKSSVCAQPAWQAGVLMLQKHSIPEITISDGPQVIIELKSDARQDVETEGTVCTLVSKGMNTDASTEAIAWLITFKYKRYVGKGFISLASDYAIVTVTGAHGAKRIVANGTFILVHRLCVEIHKTTVGAKYCNLNSIRNGGFACTIRP